MTALDPGIYVLHFTIRRMPLLPGVYSFRLGVADGNSGAALFYTDNAHQFQVVGHDLSRAWHSPANEGFFHLDATWRLTHESDASATVLSN